MRVPISIAAAVLLAVPLAGESGRIDDLAVVADLITYNQEVNVGYSTRGEGKIERRVGVITRWDLPIPVAVDPSITSDKMAAAMRYWESVTGLPFVAVGIKAEPRITVRAASAEDLNIAIGAGFVYRTYKNNRARLAVVKLRTDFADCRVRCEGLYRHELGHAIGIFKHMTGGALMAAPQTGPDASPREIAMLQTLYKLPHGAQIKPDGSWTVVR
jgi:hypothetical protein